MRLRTAVMAIGAGMLIVGCSTAFSAVVAASDRPAEPAGCATYYIVAPDQAGTPALTYFAFCGPGIRAGRWSCPVRRGERIVDTRISCRQ